MITSMWSWRGAGPSTRRVGLAYIHALPRPALAAAYLIGYVALDAISFIQPFAPFGITPWNPPTGLSFVLVLLFGHAFLPLLFVAPLLTDILVRDTPLPLGYDIVTSLVVGLGYSAALMLLLRPRLRFDPTLSSIRDVVLLTAFALASSGFVAGSYVAILAGGGVVAPEDFLPATARYWIGDLIGIMVFAPFGLIALTRSLFKELTMETLFQVLAILAALGLVFFDVNEGRLGFFYPLFLPLIWISMRTGLEGMTVGILLTQLGLILGSQFLSPHEINLTQFQTLMLVLTVTGLFAGALVSERRKTEMQLRLHQDSLARMSRIGSMGELASALAHEINQPLMAAGTYTRLVDAGLRGGIESPMAIAENAQKAAIQVQRAAEVVRRLRALMRLDSSERAPVSIAQIVRDALRICELDVDRARMRVNVSIPAGLPNVMADMLQIEQVILNLVRNAIEAKTAERGSIEIEAKAFGADFVEVTVRDDGRGFDPERLGTAPLPFLSDKAEGLGIGLSLCRSIVEAHGGALRLDNGDPGALVSFTLPVAKAATNV